MMEQMWISILYVEKDEEEDEGNAAIWDLSTTISIEEGTNITCVRPF